MKSLKEYLKEQQSRVEDFEVLDESPSDYAVPCATIIKASRPDILNEGISPSQSRTVSPDIFNAFRDFTQSPNKRLQSSQIKRLKRGL
jgi:hypothetical protein